MTSVPSTVGIVASGEDVLNDAVFWIDAGRSSVVTDSLSNLGTGGSALNARFGSTTSPDQFDPTLLTHSGTNYVYLTGVAGNSVSCTAPAAATSYAATPLGGGADTTGAVTGGAAFTFSATGSWTTVRLLNASSATVAQFTVTAADMTGMTDAYSVAWTVNRSTAGKKTATVTRSILLFGTDDYLEVADNDLLDFGASDSFTVVAVLRQWATPTSFGRLIDKKNGGGAALGWQLANNGTAIQPGLYIGDTTNQTAQVGSTSTAGQLRVFGGQVDRSAQRIYGINNTLSAGVSTTSVGALTNTLPMRIGVNATTATNNQDFELVAAAVWRRALNANEIATIVARYS